MYVERDITSIFQKLSQVYNMIAMVGARQAGKTTFLKHMMEDQDSSYILFDDPDARILFNEDIKKFELQYVEGHEITVMDEVQYCTDAGSKLKYLVDSGRKMWITSSSEIILGKEILSYLVGRISVLHLYPFSIHEFLSAKGVRALIPEILRRNIWEHMTYGGYPKVVTTPDPSLKKVILKDLFETMLLKDVAKTFSITETASLERLIQYLAVINGGIISYDTVADDLNISYRTLKKYLDAFSKSYLIVEVRPYSTNPKKEITKQPKIYFIDTGVRNTIVKQFNPEPDGILFENYTLTELIKMGLTPKYWRTKSKAEVDFIVERDNKVIPVEVKLQARSGKVSRSMRSFIETYKPEMALIVSYNHIKDKRTINGCTVHFIDIMGMWKLLGGRDFEV